MKDDPRHAWAVETMDVQPSDSILEIGCGTGITAGLVAEKFNKGVIVAIDRSEAQIQKALKRNDAFIKQGKATFLTGNFSEIEIGKRFFDKVFAFNVSLFWKNPEKELAIIKTHLKQDGTLFIFYQPPDANSERFTHRTVMILEQNDFEITKAISSPISCVAASKRG